MKTFATLALAGFATAMTTVETITDPALKTSLEYSVMDGDLSITMTMTPEGGLFDTQVVTGTVIMATSRMLTEEEKTQLLALDFEEATGGPAASGFTMTYMDITGLAPEAPVEGKFEPSCSHADERELPEDADPSTLCGWVETEAFAPSADSKMVSGTAKRPLDVKDWELKVGQSYDVATIAVNFDFSTLEGEPTEETILAGAKVGLVKLDLMDGSGAFAALTAGVTALVATLAF